MRLEAEGKMRAILNGMSMIGDPVNKSKSLILTDEGLERSEALFRELFTRPPR